MVNIMAEDWKNQDTSKRSEMMKNQKILRFLAITALSICQAPPYLNAIKKLHSNHSLQSNSSSARIQFFSAKFIFNSENSPIFEITWLGQMLASIFCVIIFASFDVFFWTTVFHLYGQLNILKLDIYNLVSVVKTQTFNQAIKPILRRDLHVKRLFL